MSGEVTLQLSSASFLSTCCMGLLVEFNKRDILLVAGLVLFMIGLMPFMAPIYAIIVVSLMYFGIKFYVAKRNQIVRSEFGEEGICMECGFKVVRGRCPSCDDAQQEDKK